MTHTIEQPGPFGEEEFRKFLFSLYSEEATEHPKVFVDLRKTTWCSLGTIVLLRVLQDDFANEGRELDLILNEENLLARLWAFMKKVGSEQRVAHLFQSKIIEVLKCMTSTVCFDFSNRATGIVRGQLKGSENAAIVLSWIISELADNSGVHGYQCHNGEAFPKPVYTSLFSWDDELQVVICDRGLGIVNTLRRFGKGALTSMPAKQLIAKALEQGVSGNPFGSPGFGLYGSSELVRRAGGEMFIYSNGLYLEVAGSKTDVGTIPFPHGTFISIRIKKSLDITLDDIIQPSTQDWIIEDQPFS